jgi:hypothetical protein
MAEGNGTRTWLAVAGLAGLTLAAVVAIGSGGGDDPLDPRSDEKIGTSALVALAGELGADVTVDDRLPDLAGDGPDVIVLFVDLLDEGQRAAVDDWVDRGGRLVVTEPGSDYTPEVVGTFEEIDDLAPARTMRGRCDIDALDDIDVAGIEPRNGGVVYEPPPGSRACVDDGVGGAYIVADDRGEGTVVALGGSGLVVNAALDEGENAAVAGALVAPEQGTDLVVLEPGAVAGGGGERSLSELIPTGVGRALVQLAVAFAVYALWRARRLGRPVPEPRPVAVAGSELVAAVGNLLDRTRSPGHAADLLRADLRRYLADHLGLPTGSPPDVLATVAATRTDLDEAQLRWALGDAPVTDEAGLTALAQTIDRIREEVLTHV